MRTPQEIVMTIAYSLKEGKTGDEYSVAEVSKKTQIHYVTTSDYLNLIEYIQESIPKIKKIDSKGKAKIVITEELSSNCSQYEKTMLTLFDKGAFGKESAISIKILDEEIKSTMTQNFISGSNKDGYYLTTEGIIEAASFVEKRANKIMNLKKQGTKQYVAEDVKETWNIDGCYENSEKRVLPRAMPKFTRQSGSVAA